MFGFNIVNLFLVFHRFHSPNVILVNMFQTLNIDIFQFEIQTLKSFKNNLTTL
jgi:hypothetical protein